MDNMDLDKIEMNPIGFVRRTSSDEDVKDRVLVSEVRLRSDLTEALDRVDEWSHVYVIYWLNRIRQGEDPFLHFPATEPEEPPVGILVVKKQETKEKLLEACKRYVDRANGGPPPEGYANTF